jgi:predicted dehydrogenase
MGFSQECQIMKKENRRLRIGLLGCGPISQAAHLDAIREARNADLYAICDVTEGKPVPAILDDRIFETFIDGAGI